MTWISNLLSGFSAFLVSWLWPTTLETSVTEINF